MPIERQLEKKSIEHNLGNTEFEFIALSQHLNNKQIICSAINDRIFFSLFIRYSGISRNFYLRNHNTIISIWKAILLLF